MSTAPTHSLRRVLLAWLLTPLVVLLPLTAFVQYEYALRLVNDAFDRALGDDVVEMAGLVGFDNGEVTFSLTRQTENALRRDATAEGDFAVFDPRGNAVSGDSFLAPLRRTPPAATTLFSDNVINAVPVRVAARGVRCGASLCEVLLAQTVSERDRIGTRVLFSTLIIAIILFAVGTTAVLIAARRGLAPLEQLSAQISERSLDDLRPLDLQAAPREMAGVITAVNRLFYRVQSGAAAQRAFLADAAHQLRTPLTRLQTEIDLALLEAPTASTRPMLERFAVSTRRTARLANQMLALARSDAAAQVDPPQPFDLKQVATELAEEWVPRAISADVDLGFELASARTDGRANLVRELLSNLIHNAIEHAGKGSRVTVRTFESNSDATLEVEDDGPGIAQDQRARMFDRFVRGAESPPDGTGLGLAIVRDIARQHHATVELLDAPTGHGLLVRVRFARVDATA